jgi:hypothetical protein
MNSKQAITLIVTAILISLLLILVYESQIVYTVRGHIDDWIGNDNGFGLKVDGKIYWLDYGGNVSSPVPFGSDIVGHNCTLEYQSAMLPSLYARTIKLEVY